MTITKHAMKRGRTIRWQPLALAAAAGLLLMQAEAAAAAVPVCEALTLYGNAASSGLCQSLGTTNLWVCELAQGNPDIHLTVNATTALHITVRTPSCEGNATLAGNWNANTKNLSIASGQPTTICNVNVANYPLRLNAQSRLPAQGGASACLNAINAAANHGRISAQVQSFYAGLCKSNACP